MKPTIYLALTHDWELRGDGSGDIEEIQFAPMRRLLEIYEKFGARTTFMPDVMQQVSFRKLEGDHPELKLAADSWDEHALEAYGKVTTFNCISTLNGQTRNRKTADGVCAASGRCSNTIAEQACRCSRKANRIWKIFCSR